MQENFFLQSKKKTKNNTKAKISCHSYGPKHIVNYEPLYLNLCLLALVISMSISNGEPCPILRTHNMHCVALYECIN